MVWASMQDQSTNLHSSSPSPAGSPPLGYERISGRGSSDSRVEVRPGGLRVKREREQAAPQGGGKRGKIYGFSDASHRRMTDWMMGIPWQQIRHGDAFFVSLTWRFGYTSTSPDDVSVVPASDGVAYLPPAQADVLGRVQPGASGDLLQVNWSAADPPHWHEQLKAFRRRLEREYGDRFLGAVWKKEFQKRGAPHYHLVVFFRPGRGPEVLPFWQWVSRNWCEIVEPGDRFNMEHGAKVQLVENTSGSKLRALMRYLGKYMAKTFAGCVDVNGELLPVGRIWGVWGEVPEVMLAEVLIGWNDHVRLCRRLRRWGCRSPYLSRISAGRSGFRVWYDGELLSQLLDGMQWEPV